MVARLYITDQGFSITGKAIETISGGQIVRAVSGATVLTASNQLTNVIQVALSDAAADNATTVGVAINTAVSGEPIGVALTGVHGFFAGGLVPAGSAVYALSAQATADVVVGFDDTTCNSGFNLRFGRALSTAASGQMVAVKLGG